MKREQRRSYRLNLDLPATFQIFDVEMKPARASIQDVSAVGICFLTKTEVKPGQKITLRVTLPGKEAVAVHGTAVWCKQKVLYDVTEYRLGVKIDDPIKGDEGKFVKFYANKFMEHYRYKK